RCDTQNADISTSQAPVVTHRCEKSWGVRRGPACESPSLRGFLSPRAARGYSRRQLLANAAIAASRVFSPASRALALRRGEILLPRGWNLMSPYRIVPTRTQDCPLHLFKRNAPAGPELGFR